MANLKLTNLAAYRAYFEAIAEAHIDVDGFKYGDKDVVTSNNRSDMPARVLWCAPYQGATYLDKGDSDNVVKLKTARVAYLVTPTSELFADEDAAFDLCEATVEQILAKLLKDKAGAMVDGQWEMIATQLNSWKGAPVEMTIGSTKYIGWELSLVFLDNTALAYDAEKWA
jgi:hypothetical protein